MLAAAGSWNYFGLRLNWILRGSGGNESVHDPHHPQSDEVDQLLRNAELRDKLERYFDESISRVNVQHFSLAAENEFLAAMLAWEQAPVLAIFRWFEPELRPPRPESLGEADLHRILWDVMRKLYQKRIVLDFTDHLTDRELYCLVFRDILPAREKKIDWPNNYLHWDCTGANCDPEVWLRYYATEESARTGPIPTTSRCRRRCRCRIRGTCRANRGSAPTVLTCHAVAVGYALA